MFAFPQLQTWLSEFDEKVPVIEGPDLPEFPDRCFIVTEVGGAALIHEGAFDQLMFQVRTRGSQASQTDARDLAMRLDEFIVFSDFPMEIDGHSITSVNRTGGRPAAAPRGEDGGEDAGRYAYTCTYLIQVST